METTSTKIHLTKPTTISGEFFYTDYRTSGKMPQKSTYFRFLKSIRKIHRIRRILVPRYFLSGELLVDSHFREHGKGSTRSQNPPKNWVYSGIHRKGKKPLAFKNESYFLICLKAGISREKLQYLFYRINVHFESRAY